ncbi:hypothetical protein Tco_1299678 [Tanacetum coccineum]
MLKMVTIDDIEQVYEGDWFDQYRERVTEAETIVLTTLNFELTVQHPYAHLTSILDKLGLAQSLLVNLALSLLVDIYAVRVEFYFSSEVAQPMCLDAVSKKFFVNLMSDYRSYSQVHPKHHQLYVDGMWHGVGSYYGYGFDHRVE